jgi:hypothetical protein
MVLPKDLVTGMAKAPWIGPRVLFRLHGRGLGFDAVTWPEAVEMVVRERPAEISLDVYDTCIIRDLAGDQPIELAIGHRRTVDEVPESRDYATEMERELCRPVPGAVAGLRAMRSVVATVTFVSDTDRSSDLLIDLLRSFQLFEDGDRLFASCEVGATKSRGELFNRIWSEPGKAKSVWHLGNSTWADGAMAAKGGLRPVQIVEADINRYEAKLAEVAYSEGPAIASAARLARLDVANDLDQGKLSARQAEAQLLGADIAGQALVAFDLWLAEECQQFDVEHLGFLARDGELPMRIAQVLAADHWGNVSMAYLHCSRMVWALASASAVGLDDWIRAGTADSNAFLETQRHDVPLTALLSRIGVSVADVSSIKRPTHRDFLALDVHRPLPEDAVDLWHAVLSDPQIAELTIERSEARRRILIDYIRREGLAEGKVGLVDVGWRGRLAWHITSVMRSAGGQEPVHFHFGGTKVIPEVDQAITIRRFAFDGRTDDDLFVSPVSCVETLTASGKPRVVDYRRTSGGEVELVFGLSGEDDDGDRTDLWEGALRMASYIPSRKALDSWGVARTNLGPQIRELLAMWWNNPTRREAHAIADLAFEHDEAGTTFRPLASPYSLGELAGLSESPRAWPRGSEAVSPAPIRVLVRIAKRVRSAVRSDHR